MGPGRRGRVAAVGLGLGVVVVAAGLVVAALTDSLWWHPGPTAAASRVRGFETVAFTVTGSARRRRRPSRGCALLARTPAQRGRGLMQQRDLAGYDGMVFVWPASTDEAFYMKDTLIPLSIAWFDRRHPLRVGGHDGPLSTSGGQSCPLFSAASPYTIAIEVPEGGLARLGIGPGSSITLGGRRVPDWRFTVTPSRRHEPSSLPARGASTGRRTPSPSEMHGSVDDVEYHDEAIEPCPGSTGAPCGSPPGPEGGHQA